MKLNLLPQTVSKGRQAQSAIFFSAIIAIAGLVLGGYLNVSSTKALDSARDDQQASTGPAQKAYETSTEADTLMGLPTSVALIRDASLADAMIKHNDVYPDLYESVRPYIPSFYRINSMSATSSGGDAVVTLVGTLDTYQQYADLMLSFSRMKDLASISRSGFQSQDEFVPNIDQIDTHGTPRKQDQAPVPDDKLERLAYFQTLAQQDQSGYTGAGNFGSGTDSTRGAMPTASLVTVTMTIKNRNLTVPEPRLTLTAGAAGGASAALASLGGAGGGPPNIGGPGGRGGAAGGGAPGAAAAGGSRKGSKAGDDSGD